MYDSSEISKVTFSILKKNIKHTTSWKENSSWQFENKDPHNMKHFIKNSLKSYLVECGYVYKEVKSNLISNSSLQIETISISPGGNQRGSDCYVLYYDMFNKKF